MNIKSEKIFDGINLIDISTNKYKTNIISLYIKRPLNKNEVTKNSLLPYILKSGCNNYPSEKDIETRLQELYGSRLRVNVSKVGEKQILSFKVIYTSNKYLSENIESYILDVLFDIVFNPLLIDNKFDDKKLDIEKDTLKEVILSKINDKSSYVLDKTISVMCEGEPFSIPEDGFVDDLDNITSDILYNHYVEILKTSSIDVAIAGDVNKNVLIEKLSKRLNFEREINEIPKEDIYKIPKKVNEVVEKMDINQGKLVMGYRTNISSDDSLFVPLSVYNTILGGDVSSKLFRNVREKNSLAYSVHSSLEKMKSLMLIRAGIDFSNFEKAKDIIIEEVENMRLGNITEEELSKAKKSMINAIRTVSDSVLSISDYMYIINLQGISKKPQEIIDSIEAVTVEDIIETANNIKLDTIYFLTKEEVND